MNKKDTILIIYPPGGYGTFIEWALTYFTGGDTIANPLINETGSAHKFKGNHLDYNIDLLHYFSGTENFKFARTHAIHKSTPKEYYEIFGHLVSQVINIYPDPRVKLLLLHNKFSKISKELLNGSYEKTLLNSSVTDAVWEQRENISFWFSGYQAYINSYALQGPNIVPVAMYSIISNPKLTIYNLCEQIGLSINHNRWCQIDNLIKQWIDLQVYKSLDELCNSIVDAVVYNKDMSWNTLSLHSQAYIQWALRDLHGLDLKCYNLDVFPSNTIDLRKLLIDV